MKLTLNLRVVHPILGGKAQWKQGEKLPKLGIYPLPFMNENTGETYCRHLSKDKKACMIYIISSLLTDFEVGYQSCINNFKLHALKLLQVFSSGT